MQQKIRCESSKKKSGTEIGQRVLEIDRIDRGAPLQLDHHPQKKHSESQNACSEECIGALHETGRNPDRTKSGFFVYPIILLINFYRVAISPLFPPCCRFVPTCSGYAISALRVHGLFKGSLLTIWRILRCNPFVKGGYDPVPPKGAWRPLKSDKEESS